MQIGTVTFTPSEEGVYKGEFQIGEELVITYSALVIYNTFEVMAGSNNFLSGRT